MGSKSSKPQASPAKTLDEGVTPLLKVLDASKANGGLTAARNYAGLAAAAESIFSTVRGLLNVDVKSLPEDQQENYRKLITEYFAIIRSLSVFLDEQIAVLKLLADECAQPKPDPALVEKWYNRIDVAGCKNFTLQVHELLQRVMLERSAMNHSVNRRVLKTLAWGLFGGLVLGLTVCAGILAPPVALTVAAVATAGSVVFLPAVNQLRESIIELNNLKTVEKSLKNVEAHLKRIHQSMSDTHVAYVQLGMMGYTHERLGQYAEACIADLQKARKAVLSA